MKLPSYRFTNIRSKISFYIVSLYIVLVSLTTYSNYLFDLNNLDQTFNQNIEVTITLAEIVSSTPLWNYDTLGLDRVLDALVQNPNVKYISIKDSLSNVPRERILIDVNDKQMNKNMIYATRDITFNESVIGSITIGLSKVDGLNQLKSNLYNSMIRVAISIVFLMLFVNEFSKRITKNIVILTKAAVKFSNGNLSESIDINSSDEIGILANSFRTMQTELKKSFERVTNQLIELEDKNTEIQVKNKAIMDLNINLEHMVNERTKELEASLEALKQTQEHLIESEKMSLIGTLVAGVAHEINTPVGVSLTACSFLNSINSKSLEQLKDGTMTKDNLIDYMKSVSETTEILDHNLTRASNLVVNFKRISLDYHDDSRMEFNVNEYLNKIAFTLKHELKKSNHSIEIMGSEDLVIYSYPGIFSQIFTNLMMNSIKHGFDDLKDRKITVNIQVQHDSLFITHHDDGHGISPDLIGKIFDPFYTTKRHDGGSGLGLFIVSNLVTQKLNGSISIVPNLEKGTQFNIIIPMKEVAFNE